MKIEYSSNNSGGRWWLEDKDWYALEAAGWKVRWFSQPENQHMFSTKTTGRWLGALASACEKEFEIPGDAMREFEKVTGQSVTDRGCNCCGSPHSFSWHNGYASGERCLGHMFKDGPKTLREAWEKK